MVPGTPPATPHGDDGSKHRRYCVAPLKSGNNQNNLEAFVGANITSAWLSQWQHKQDIHATASSNQQHRPIIGQLNHTPDSISGLQLHASELRPK